MPKTPTAQSYSALLTQIKNIVESGRKAIERTKARFISYTYGVSIEDAHAISVRNNRSVEASPKDEFTELPQKKGTLCPKQ